jgi:CRISPR-associated protein Csb1
MVALKPAYSLRTYCTSFNTLSTGQPLPHPQFFVIPHPYPSNTSQTKGDIMTTSTPLTLASLTAAIAGDGIGLRARIELEPLGGPGDKVFPASYSVADRAETKYAVEHRRINGADVPAVLLNSVAAEANRFELALLEAFRNGEIGLPVVSIDFASAGLPEYDRLSCFEVSHRIYDAALRDSLLNGVLFRLSDIGRAITDATPRSAAGLFRYSPSSLLFGAWDPNSSGP